MKKLFALSLALCSSALLAGYKTDGAFDISTNGVSLIVSYEEDKTPHFEHFGKRVDPSDFVGLRELSPSDVGAPSLLYPERGGKNFLCPALAVKHSDGDLNTELRFVAAKKSLSKDGNVETTVVELKDAKHEFFVNLIFEACKKENVITERAEIINREAGEVALQNFASSAATLRAGKYFLTHINGQWAHEGEVSEDELTRGTKSIQSRKLVRTTLSENPAFMLSLDTPRNEKIGEVVAGALAWSGNYEINFEYDEFGRLNIISGIMPVNYALAKGEKFETPKMVLTYSASGSGRASRNLHDWARNYGLYNGNAQRPIILNCWEGVSFNVNEPVLREIIDDAADLGAELFVVDDGWFGSEKYPRNNERAGLGDWTVNRAKLPNGVDPIASYAASKGLKFGIWIEPEMVNPKSELAEKRPDWIVGAKGREKPQIRNQWLLDLSNPEVQDFVFGVFDSVMQSSKHISYIKWDANRHLEQIGSAHTPAGAQERFYIDYVRGLESVFNRIRAKYPDVIIQACGSGGGRIDYLSFKYCDEAWGSDNTSPAARLFIQYAESLFYPVKAIGAHVPKSGSRNLETSMKFRSDVSMMARFGIELRPANLPPQDRAELKRAVGVYKKIRDVVCDGDLYRLISPFESRTHAANLFVSKDKSRAVLFLFQRSFDSVYHRPFFRLDGLDPDAKYKITEINTSKPISPMRGKTFSGRFLMERGVNAMFNGWNQSAVLELERVK